MSCSKQDGEEVEAVQVYLPIRALRRLYERSSIVCMSFLTSRDTIRSHIAGTRSSACFAVVRVRVQKQAWVWPGGTQRSEPALRRLQIVDASGCAEVKEAAKTEVLKEAATMSCCVQP